MKKALPLLLIIMAFIVIAGCKRESKPTTTQEPVVPLPANAQVITGRDGALMVYVPGGVFIMGTDKGKPEEGPHMNVFLESFYIDRFEISNERFARFVREAKYEPLKKFSFRPGTEQNPATGINWLDAKSYCEWAGKRLPIEYEWEKAARGPDGRMWPWGNDQKAPKQGSAGLNLVTLPEYDDPPGQSPYGLLHTADNVWEWVDDWFLAYVLSDREDPRFGKTFKVLRGGLTLDKKIWGYSRTTDRLPMKPEERSDSTGARCAVDAGASQ